MKIILNNNRCQILGKVKQVMELRDHPAFAIKVKGAFFSEAFRKGRWDGHIRFITEAGIFDTGKLPQLIDVMKGLFPKEPITIIDKRKKLKAKMVKKLGEAKLRDYQQDVVETIINNEVEGVPFPRCIIGAATNAGKTIISAGIHAAFKSKTVFLLSSKELFQDAVRDIPKFLPGQVGVLASGHETQWNDFMIIMAPTLRVRMKEVYHKLLQYKVVIVDECDLGTSKTYKDALSAMHESYVRVGLSGSAMVDPRKKELNEKLRATFGNIIYQIKNIELMKKGWSSKVVCEIHTGNTHVKVKRDFVSEYTNGVIKNIDRNKKIVMVAKKDVRKDRLPLLIITKNHAHVRRLYKRVIRLSNIVGHEFFGLKIEWVHHKRKDRRAITEKFEQGKFDILIGSYILKRGKNFPLMRSIIHAGAGDSMAGVLQILGRATRKSDTKSYTMYHDFYDIGAYLLSHSKHRISVLKKEEIKIHENY